MICIRLLFAAACSTLLAGTIVQAGAQTVGAPSRQTPIAAPEHEVGDTWVYNKINGWNGELEFVVVSSVIDLSPRGAVVEAVVPGSTIVTRMQRDAGFNLVRTETPNGVQTISPFYPSYAFPLAIGQTWTQRVSFANTAQPDKNVTAWFEGRVVGWELVTVPAGTFDAIRIETKANYQAHSAQGSWSGTIMDRLWYAPAVRNAVKYEYQDTVDTLKYTHEVFELVRFWNAP